MSNKELFKRTADTLRHYFLTEHDYKLKASHAHELVAYSLGRNSKVALLHDEDFTLDPDYPETYEIPNSEQTLSVRMPKLKGLPLEQPFMDAELISEIVLSAIRPACDICGREGESVPIFGKEGPHVDKWACHACAEEGEEVGFCIYCDTEHVYAVADLNQAGECLYEHAGESDMDEEEREDWDSYIEKLNKDG